MNTSTYQNLVEEHFCHQLWRTDLDMAQVELAVFERLVGQVNPISLTGSPQTQQFIALTQEIHHFRRVLPDLQQSLQEVEKQLAHDIQSDQKIGAETRKDHAYLKEEMADFDRNYRKFRQKVRDFFS